MAVTFYWDEARGGFFDAREQQGGFLGERAKPIQDSPTSSPNATAALVLLRLSAITEEPAFRDRAERLLAAFAGSAGELGIHGAAYLRALDFMLNGECRIVVADTTTNGPLVAAARAAYRPRKVLVPTARSPIEGRSAPLALVCAGTTCAAPVTTAESLRETLETFARAG